MGVASASGWGAGPRRTLLTMSVRRDTGWQTDIRCVEERQEKRKEMKSKTDDEIEEIRNEVTIQNEGA